MATARYPDKFVDLVRQDAYPIDAPEGAEYERARVRECLEAVGGFRVGKEFPPLVEFAARDEAAEVLRVCFKAVFGSDPELYTH